MIKNLLLLSLLVSCSSAVINRTLVTPKPVWLDAPARFRLSSLYEKEGRDVHPFFDHLPFIDLKKNMLNVVITTPEDSSVEYDLDLLSGKFYIKRRYCEQNDVWETYSKTLDVPPYTLAIVPRLLDSMGYPQQVLIFGGDDYFHQHYADKNGEDALKSVRVKIIGSKILQFCELYPCKRNQWQSRLLLLAVDPLDKNFSQVTNFVDLQRQVNWKKIKAFVENGFGRSFDGMKSSSGKPAYRLIDGADGSKSLRFAITKGHYFKFSEMKKIRKNCFRLYDYIWDSVQAIRTAQINTEKRLQKKIKRSFDDLAKRKTILSGNVLQSITENDTKIKQPKHFEYFNFAAFMKLFVKKYAEDFYICSKYVRSASINNSPERTHFMTYLTIFIALDRLGHDFNCSTGAWIPRKRFYMHHQNKSLAQRLEYCDTPRLNRVFSTMKNYLNALNKTDHPSYFYIDYDMVPQGTHQKLYSWIYTTGKKILCNDDYDSDGNIIAHKSHISREAIPHDFRWNDFIDASQKQLYKNGYIR